MSHHFKRAHPTKLNLMNGLLSKHQSSRICSDNLLGIRACLTSAPDLNKALEKILHANLAKSLDKKNLHFWIIKNSSLLSMLLVLLSRSLDFRMR